MPTTSTIAPWLLSHFEWDLALWFCFFLGQCLFVLKRSAMAVRSKINPIKSRRQYLYQNWDILTIRFAIESATIFYPWRHGDLPGIFQHFGWTLWFKIPDGAIAASGLGYLADSGLDWISTFSKAPQWLKENIPQLPIVVTSTEQTTVQHTEIHTTTMDVKPKEGA